MWTGVWPIWPALSHPFSFGSTVPDFFSTDVRLYPPRNILFVKSFFGQHSVRAPSALLVANSSFLLLLFFPLLSPLDPTSQVCCTVLMIAFFCPSRAEVPILLFFQVDVLLFFFSVWDPPLVFFSLIFCIPTFPLVVLPQHCLFLDPPLYFFLPPFFLQMFKPPPSSVWPHGAHVTPSPYPLPRAFSTCSFSRFRCLIFFDSAALWGVPGRDCAVSSRFFFWDPLSLASPV